MTSLTNCEFMVKGYHYTKPTDPIMTDSCRLYLDTTIDGEECEIDDGDYSYIGYYIKGWADGHIDGYDKINFQGFLPKNINSDFSGYVYIKNFDGTNFSDDYYFGHFTEGIGIAFPSGIIAPGGRACENIFENKTDDITGNYSFTDQFGAEYNFTISAVEYGDLLTLPETAILTSANSQEIIEELIPDQDNLIWSLTLNQYIDTSAMAYITLPGAPKSVSGPFLSHDWYYEPEDTAVTDITYTIATRELVMTLSNWSNDYTIPTIRYTVGDSFRTHLKGIHGFYVQT